MTCNFLDMIAKSDILGLAEIHANKEICIPGIILNKQKIREKGQREKKEVGGGV